MKIEWVSPQTLTPYPQNAKKHPPEQIDHIANSIKQFGWQQPIVVDKNKVVIIGHGRLFAARQLMLDSVPVVSAENLTDDQVKALRLADNQTAISDYDFSLLEQELAALDIAGVDMSMFGFEVGEDFEDHSEIQEDEIPDLPDEPVAKLGQIFQLGEHRLMCGDSTDAEAVKNLMGGAMAEVLLTDPPYGINAVERGGHNNGKKSRTSNGKR